MRKQQRTIDSKSQQSNNNNVDKLGKQMSQTEKQIDWSKVTPYDLIRINNCKTFNFVKSEHYPSIRPAVSKCNPEKSVELLLTAAEESGCGHYFDMEQDDVIDVWNKSLDKKTLCYYGVSSGQPEKIAQEFDKALAKSMRNATSVVKPKIDSFSPKPINPLQSTEPCRPLVLNRQLLQEKLKSMPTVQRKMNASEAFSILHCPLSTETKYPFAKDEPKISLVTDFDIVTPAPKEKQAPRRKYKYCGLQCGIPENECTAYEWTKYKQDPKQQDEAFEIAMKQKAEPIVEPRDYDELFEQLITCFEQYSKKDSLCELYERCCNTIRDNTSGAGGDGQGDGGARIKFPAIEDRSGAPGIKVETVDDKSSKDLFEKEKQEKDETVGRPDGAEHVKTEKKHPKKSGRTSETDAGKGKKEKKEEKKVDEGKGIKLEKPTRPKKVPSSEDNRNVPEHISEPDSVPSTSADKGKKKKKKKLTDKQKSTKSKTKDASGDKLEKKPSKDCPCEICKFMKRRETESDPPFISQLKREDKRRQLREYYRIWCHREQLKCRKPEYLAPQHKCDPIVCDDFFCKNPNISKYCDCLKAMQELQKQLGPKHRIVKNELIFNLEDLRSRLCKRLCDCLS